jgi:Disaggregatase related.
MTQKCPRNIYQKWVELRSYVLILTFLILLDAFSIYILIRFKSPIIPLKSIVFVTAGGSGNFTCDGIDDQVEINKALAYVVKNPQFTTVYLKGPNTYVLSDSVFIGNNTVLKGDSTAVIKLKDKANWTAGKPLITQMNMIGIHGVTIKGFEIDGNHDNNLDKPNGYGYYNMIRFRNASDIQIHDMYMHDGHGDGVRVEDGFNIQFYNNIVYKTGHNDLFVENCLNVDAWDNKLTVRTDCGLKASNSNHVRFHDNLIDSFYHWNAGGAGIMIGKTTGIVNNVEIYNNTIQNTYGPGIWLIGSSKSYSKDEAKNVHIYHNVLNNTGTNPNIDWVGGIVTSGFYDTLIENNTFDDTYHAAIVHIVPKGDYLHIYPTDVGHKHFDLFPKDTGYTTIVRNNIIANTKQRKKDPDGTGYGVINYIPEISSFVLEHNCLYNNYAGNYLNCTSTTDIYIDPLLLNQSIGAGYSSEEHPEGINQTIINSIYRNGYS